MKKYLILVLISAALVFSSCSSLPEQGSSDDVLVIGNLMLDFPDGFFEESSRTVKSNIKIKTKNLTTGEEKNVTTKNGYFHLIGKKGDLILLSEYNYKKREDNCEYTLGNDLKMKFYLVDNAVNYTGHMMDTYSAGNVSGHQGSTSTYFSFKKTFSNKNKQQEALDYYKFNNPDSSWFENGIEMIELK